MILSETSTQFILHWGEMGTRWGVNRTVAQVHALLYLSPESLTAEDIAETLSVARSNVSTSLKELETTSRHRRMCGRCFLPSWNSAWNVRLFRRSRCCGVALSKRGPNVRRNRKSQRA